MFILVSTPYTLHSTPYIPDASLRSLLLNRCTSHPTPPLSDVWHLVRAHVDGCCTAKLCGATFACGHLQQSWAPHPDKPARHRQPVRKYPIYSLEDVHPHPRKCPPRGNRSPTRRSM